ncbi:alpha/beta fold hydrolase [Stackebrandtia nassauensis]|uniref:Alpha/beta hydrolase fold protein n=1 Tax=Stackebrandtia nassauensis (strain DSM 44728 / CIP 108903 / NRRL B-16338 / NBRC 102104 / LLR-40K-21) TaxID=446470 RepID=D3Q5X5_STANL|nr:alpha/beta hydrolase [Stackebrandtia nassauensis]ADD40274.1 alpha/beta hydrolase fold protein [Stackebrandtia nassauensis DSM 44728]
MSPKEIVGNKKTSRAGIIGAVAGLAAAGIAAGVATERYLIKRARSDPNDPYAEEPFANLHADDIRTITTADGIDVHVETVDSRGVGEAEATAVFVHGFCLDMGTFHFQRRALTESTMPLRAVYYDQPGHGQSGELPLPEYDIESLAEALYAVLAKAVPTGPVFLVGHSMGGMTILAFARRYPELFASRVRGVALLSTTAGGLDKVSFGAPKALARARKVFLPALSKAIALTPGVIDGARRVASDLAWRLTRRYGFATRKPSPSLVSYVEKMNTATPIKTVIGFSKALLEHDEHDVLPQLASIPVFISCGDSDQFTPPEHSVALAEALPHAKLNIVPEAGHVALLEKPELVTDPLFAHLSECLDALERDRQPAEPVKRRKPWLRKKKRTGD